MSPQCIVHHWSWKQFFYSQLALPVIVVAVHLLFYAAAKCMGQPPENLEGRWTSTVHGFFGFMSIIYLTICRYCFGSLYCIQMPPTSGKYVLSMNPTIACWDSSHYIAVVFGIAGLVIYVAGYPILCAIILYHIHKHRSHNQLDMLEKYGVLYETYEPGKSWYFVWTIIEKMLFAFISTFDFSPQLQILLAQLLAIAHVTIIIHVQPYNDFDTGPDLLKCVSSICLLHDSPHG